MGSWHMDVGSGWWIIGPIMMIAFWGGLFWLISSVINGQRSQPSSGDAGISPKEVADLRFASGEIDEVEHGHILNRLGG